MANKVNFIFFQNYNDSNLDAPKSKIPKIAQDALTENSSRSDSLRLKRDYQGQFVSRYISSDELQNRERQVIQMAENGELGKLQALLNSGFVLSAEIIGLAVIAATKKGFSDIVRTLLPFGKLISVDHKDLAVLFAVERCDNVTLEMLLSNFPAVSEITHDIAVFKAASSGNLLGVELLFANNERIGTINLELSIKAAKEIGRKDIESFLRCRLPS